MESPTELGKFVVELDGVDDAAIGRQRQRPRFAVTGITPFFGASNQWVTWVGPIEMWE